MKSWPDAEVIFAYFFYSIDINCYRIQGRIGKSFICNYCTLLYM